MPLIHGAAIKDCGFDNCGFGWEEADLEASGGDVSEVYGPDRLGDQVKAGETPNGYEKSKGKFSQREI